MLPSYRKRCADLLQSIIARENASMRNRCISRRKFSHGYKYYPHLPRQFLEAYDDLNFDPLTHQRSDVLFDPVDGKPPLCKFSDSPSVNVSWELDETVNTKRSNRDKNGNTTCSLYSDNWIRVQEDYWRLDPADFDCQWRDVESGRICNDGRNDVAKRVLWSNWTEDMIRDPSVSPILFHYDNLHTGTQSKLETRFGDTEEKRLLKALYQYGLVLITGTPTKTDSLPETFVNPTLPQNNNSQESAESAILHLSSLVGYHPLHTLYGSGVWSTSSKSSFYNEDEYGDSSASIADSAYGSTSLPLHTDMTYMVSPPGVQIFLMVQPATAPVSKYGDNRDKKSFAPTGQSVYLDGFSAACQLQIENPKAFEILATTTRKYRCIDDQEGWYLEAFGPVIEATLRENTSNGSQWGPVKSVRHNDLDRLPSLPPYTGKNHDSSTSDQFYKELRQAHKAWDNILRRDSARLVIGLQPGDCVLVANNRCMHGRYAFDASYFPRVVMGCYVGMDELHSKWRANGFRVL